MRGMANLSLSAVLVLMISGFTVPVMSSDVNWGKKVNCFVVEETVVCPGCNYRAGLSCPRKLKDSQNCLEPSTQPPPLPTESKLPKTTYEEINSTATSTDTNEIQKEATKSPFDMTIYLYRLLGSRPIPSYRSKREIEQQEEEEEELEICNWNGDCPCPLICCKTGPGCPKRCVMGIRLPPPWG